MPKVSVIIPTYNHARYLGEAIQSALDQTYQDLEIIVIDDGSTDSTPQVVSTFGDRVRYVWQENRGLSAARNTGIRIAEGEIIALLDADDKWAPEYLATMVPALQSDESIGAAYCGWRYVDAHGKELPQIAIKTVPPDQLYATLAYSNFLNVCGVIVRRACFDHVGLFDESLRACEDWDMWLRILPRYQMVGVPQALVRYRIHGRNMTADLERMATARRAVVQKHFGPEEGDPATWPPIRRRAYGGLYLNMALAHLQQGHRLQAQEYLRRAFTVYPQLASKLDAFYEIGCAHQPPGFHGVFSHLDLNRSVQDMLGSLQAVFEDDVLPTELQRIRSEAYGHAYLALGLLAYGCRHMGQTRGFLLRAIMAYPPVALRHRQVVSKFLKSLLGRRLLDALKEQRAALRLKHS
ncbi:MAG: glycosyltransferase [Chloroflexi bacterium]|nr:glycosyltransferase [Chloroflexota bacterium]